MSGLPKRFPSSTLITMLFLGCGGGEPSAPVRSPASAQRASQTQEMTGRQAEPGNLELPRMTVTEYEGPRHFTLLDGATKDLQTDDRAPIVLVYVWVTYSPQGLLDSDLQIIDEAIRENPKKREALLLNYGGTAAEVSDLVTARKIGLPVALDPEGSINKFLPGFEEAVPQLLVIDRDGIVRRRRIGPLSDVDVLSSLRELESKR